MQIALLVSWIVSSMVGGIFSWISPARAENVQAIEAAVNVPAVMWSMGQNFNSTVGFDATLYLPRFFDPAVNDYLQVGYDSLPVKADGTSSYRLIPIVVGIEAPGRVSDTVKTTFGVGVGGAVEWFNVINSQTTQIKGAFAVQVRPGIEFQVADQFSIVGRTPIYFLISSKSISLITFDLGVKVKF